MRTLAAVLLLGLTGCGLDIFGPDVRIVGRRPLADVPIEYREWYAATERCRGMVGDFDAVRWFVADAIFREDDESGAIVTNGDEITILESRLRNTPTIRHESDHHITGRGMELHLPDGGTACDGRH